MDAVLIPFAFNQNMPFFKRDGVSCSEFGQKALDNLSAALGEVPKMWLCGTLNVAQSNGFEIPTKARVIIRNDIL